MRPHSRHVSTRGTRPRVGRVSVLPDLTLVALVLLGAMFAWQHAVGVDGVHIDATDAAPAADLRIADLDTIAHGSDCADVGPYVDVPSAPPLVMDDARPGAVLTRFVCVRNAGTSPVAVSIGIVGARSTEIGCTGDEPDHDPDGSTCGTAGELGTDVAVEVGAAGGATCAGAAAHPVRFGGVANTALRPLGPTVASGAFACYRIDAAYLAFTPEDEVQADQSDRATWRFRFEGEDAVDDAVSDRGIGAGDLTPDGPLARTGAETWPLAVVATLLLAAGGALLVVRSRWVGRGDG